MSLHRRLRRLPSGRSGSLRAIHGQGFILLLPLAFGACGGDEPAPAEVVRTDSTGVEIVESRGPLWSTEDAPTVSPTPRVRIGAVDGLEEYQLFDVQFATVLGDERIVVGNGGTSEVRYFTPAGEFELAVGGPGEGPGEFSFLSSAFSRLPGDTLRTYDGSTRRITDFAPDGGLVHSTPLTGPDGGDLGAHFAGTFRDGRIAVSVLETPPATEVADGEIVRPARIYWTLQPDGSPDTPITTIVDRELLVRLIDGRQAFVTLPLRVSPQAVTHDELIVTLPDRNEVRWYAADGRLRRIARWDAPVRELTPQLYDRYIESLPYPPDRRARIREQSEGLSLPVSVPSIAGIRVGPAGEVWLEKFRLTPDEPSGWTVLAPDGAWLGDVIMPDGLNPLDIGRDYVIGVSRDELDVEYVDVHSLERR